jgi:hypothetical protein
MKSLVTVGGLFFTRLYHAVPLLLHVVINVPDVLRVVTLKFHTTATGMMRAARNAPT